MKHLMIAVALTLPLMACSSPQQIQDKEIASAHISPRKNIVATSQFDFSTTDANLQAALAKRKLKVFAVVDHGAGAKSVGKDIGASKLYIFGNPKSGTPLMMSNPQMGLELPMKILIHQEGDEVHIAHADIRQVAGAYGISDKAELLGNIRMTLHTLIEETGG